MFIVSSRKEKTQFNCGINTKLNLEAARTWGEPLFTKGAPGRFCESFTISLKVLRHGAAHNTGLLFKAGRWTWEDTSDVSPLLESTSWHPSLQQTAYIPQLQWIHRDVAARESAPEIQTPAKAMGVASQAFWWWLRTRTPVLWTKSRNEVTEQSETTIQRAASQACHTWRKVEGNPRSVPPDLWKAECIGLWRTKDSELLE